MTQGRFHSQPNSGVLFDAEQLARQTGGDTGLAAEVLALFRQQIEETLVRLDGSAPDAVTAAMHRLKGSARAVGAFALADTAAALENAPSDGALRTALVRSARETLDALRPLLSGAA